MITKIKKVYYCEYCKRHGLLQNKMQEHEERCFMNPANDRPCFHCRYLVKKGASFPDGGSINILFCEKKKQYLYTPQNFLKDNVAEIDDEINAMPTKCEHCNIIQVIAPIIIDW